MGLESAAPQGRLASNEARHLSLLMGWMNDGGWHETRTQTSLTGPTTAVFSSGRIPLMRWWWCTGAEATRFAWQNSPDPSPCSHFSVSVLKRDAVMTGSLLKAPVGFEGHSGWSWPVVRLPSMESLPPPEVRTTNYGGRSNSFSHFRRPPLKPDRIDCRGQRTAQTRPCMEDTPGFEAAVCGCYDRRKEEQRSSVRPSAG